MTNNVPKAFHMAPLQKLTVKPITDPAERAALRESAKRSRRAAPIFNAGDSCEETLLAVLEWCRYLSAEDRFAFVTELVAQLSAEQRSELKERLTAQVGGIGSP